ncbi:MAG: hypothetical protein JWO73_185 [Candidatus Taylorbacteria bacterium]|nr:hypothetical protein [Candidatus Taylorbacteria bacterium]
MDQISLYFDQAQKSLFRFEGLQDYTAMDGEEIVRHFIETGSLQIRPEDTEWWQEMRKKRERGIRTSRVRLVTKPLNDYTRWELAAHAAASAYSGDDIRVVESDRFRELFPEQFPDFWMIDDAYVFLLEYGPRGMHLGSVMADEKDVPKYIEYKNMLMEDSVKIAEYEA